MDYTGVGGSQKKFVRLRKPWVSWHQRETCTEQGVVGPAQCCLSWLSTSGLLAHLAVCRMAAFGVQRGAVTLCLTSFLPYLSPDCPGQVRRNVDILVPLRPLRVALSRVPW